jgi:undecaprenyl-diphosphatase
MTWWQAIVLGLVEGVTEYLPVSSTGHLILVQRLLGVADTEAARAYAIVIQGGAIAAVLYLYYGRVRQIVRGLLGADGPGRRLLVNLVAAFVPAAAIGLLLERRIKEYLFGGERWGLWPTVAAWLVGGIAILVLEALRDHRTRRRTGIDLERLGWQGAVGIGFAQCLALWPGTSRSLVTILGGMLAGLSVPAAVEFSFLLGLVTLGAATAHDALGHGRVMLAAYGSLDLMLGFVVAWLSAVAAIRWMVGYLTRHGLGIFGWYRIGLAVAVAAWLLAGGYSTAG